MTVIDPQSVRCPYCRQPGGCPCRTFPCARLASRPHAARVRLGRKVAANNDPALDEWWPKIGPCGVCGVPGMHQRHRVIDAIADWLETEPGVTDDDLAAEYEVPPQAVRAVRDWARRGAP